MPEVELRRQILEKLDEIKDPCSCAQGTPMGLTEMGLIGSIDLSCDGDVQVNLRLTSPFCHMIAFLQAEAVQRVGSVPGVRSVTVKGDEGLDWSPSMISPEAQARRDKRLQERFARAVGAG